MDQNVIRDSGLRTNEERRAIARRAERILMDHALPFAALSRGRGQRIEAEEHPSGLPAVCRVRVFAPLIDPNITVFGRVGADSEALATPRRSPGPDGVTTYEWQNAADLAAGFAAAHDVYLEGSEDGARAWAQRLTENYYSGLDSWHSPLTLQPVRHVFHDGTPTQFRWMAVDGSLRLWGLRRALAATFARFPGPLHPYADPRGDWNAEPVANLRKAHSMLLAHEGEDGVHRTAALEDWADLLTPGGLASDGADMALLLWVAREHMGDPDDEYED